MLRIISWNVLYRKYEEQYNSNSSILKKYPNEYLRAIQIVTFIYKQITENTIICLQEVSSMVLNNLTAVFRISHNIYHYQDSNEDFLVTITPKNFRLDFCQSHKTSNGYMSVTDGKMYVINCHLKPQRYISKNTNILEHLKSFRKTNNQTFIAGDFNENHKIVKSKLDNDFICPYYGKTYKSRAIDHIIFDTEEKNSYEVKKVDNEFISDHDMIILDIEL